MKNNKLMLLMVGFLSLMLVTGCGAKTEKLECKKTSDDSGFKIEEVHYYEFRDNNVKKFESTMTSTPVKDEVKDFLDIYAKTIDESFKELNDKKGIEYTSETKDGSHKLIIKIDYDKLDLKEFDNASDQTKDIIEEKDKKVSASETKKEMEEEDYTCTIK